MKVEGEILFGDVLVLFEQQERESRQEILLQVKRCSFEKTHLRMYHVTAPSTFQGFHFAKVSSQPFAIACEQKRFRPQRIRAPSNGPAAVAVVL